MNIEQIKSRILEGVKNDTISGSTANDILTMVEKLLSSKDTEIQELKKERGELIIKAQSRIRSLEKERDDNRENWKAFADSLGKEQDKNKLLQAELDRLKGENEWFDFEIKKPPIGVEIIGKSSKWIHPDYNKNGIRIGFLNEDAEGEFISAKWDNNQDFYETKNENDRPEQWKYIKV